MYMLYGVIPKVSRFLDLAIEPCDRSDDISVWSGSNMADVDFLRQKLKTYPDFPLQVKIKT